MENINLIHGFDNIACTLCLRILTFHAMLTIHGVMCKCKS